MTNSFDEFHLSFLFTNCLQIDCKNASYSGINSGKVKCQKARSFQRRLHLLSSGRSQAHCMGGNSGAGIEVQQGKTEARPCELQAERYRWQ